MIDWGLGHATRSLPLIRRLADLGYDVTVSSCGNALQLLKLELGNSCSYLELPNIDSSFLRDYHYIFLLPKVLTVEGPKLFRKIKREKNCVEEAIDQYRFDMLISDGCHGAVSTKLPCYFLGHQLKPLWFSKDRLTQLIIEMVISFLIKDCTRILVPDYPDSPLSASLSKNFTFIDEKKIDYVGILSDYTRQSVQRDIDYLVLISGHEPQRSSFQDLLLEQVDALTGKVVVCLGLPQRFGKAADYETRFDMYNFLLKSERDNLMNRAKFVISRMGYSTVMDLIETRAPAGLFIPTPNHTEQEFLAKIHHRARNVYAVKQNRLNLQENIGHAQRSALFQGREFPGTEHSIQNCLKVLFN